MKKVYVLAPDYKEFAAFAETAKRYFRGEIELNYLEIYEDAEGLVLGDDIRLYATKNYWLNMEHYEIMRRLKKNNPNFDFGDIY